MPVHYKQYATSQEAWEDINESFLMCHPDFFECDAVINNSILGVYNSFISIRKAWVDPEFDYGKMFNYREQKWTTLVNNYLDLNKLDLLRSNINYNEAKRNPSYNLSYLFNNTHDNGKGCLLSATFSKRLDFDIPVITLVLRSSEITKRLIFDLLLIQRMGEYIYGEGTTFALNLFITQMYCNAETVLMYNTYKPVKKFIKKSSNDKWKKNALEKFKKFFDSPESFGTYKVFLRSAKSINPEAFNHKPVSMYAKDMKLTNDWDEIEFPEECISLSDRKKYVKNLKKKKQ